MNAENETKLDIDNEDKLLILKLLKCKTIDEKTNEEISRFIEKERGLDGTI